MKSSTQPAPVVPGDPQLVWSAQVQGGQLVVDYSVHNDTAAPIYVCSGLIVPVPGGFSAVARPVVAPGEGSEAVLSLGQVPSMRPMMVAHAPVFQKVAPGEKAAGKLQIPLPIAGWHNEGSVNALPPGTDRLRLRIAWFTGEPPEWETLSGPDGAPIQTPRGTEQRWYDGGQRPLPGP